MKWRWIWLSLALSAAMIYYGLFAPTPPPGRPGWPLLPAVVLLLVAGVAFAIKTKEWSH